MFRLGLAILNAIALVGVSAASAFAQPQVCEPVDQSAEMILPDVTLTWDSSHRCGNAPETETYEITVTITNDSGSIQAVQIDDLQLTHTTPRPQGQSPDATAESSGLPLVIAPGQSGTFSVSGSYKLVKTDEGEKANLHLRAVGQGVDSAEPFGLGINVQLRRSGAVEDAGGTNGGGRPPWAGRPPFPTIMRQHRAAHTLNLPPPVAAVFGSRR